MISHRSLRRTNLLFLACWLAAVGLPAQEKKENDKDNRSAEAVRIAARRFQVPPQKLSTVNEMKVGDVFRIKVVDSQGGRIEAVDLDANHREVSREKVEALLAAAWSAGFQGKLENDLVAKVRGRSATEPIEVLVWMKSTEPPRIERSDTSRAAEPSLASLSALQTHHLNATEGLRVLAQTEGWKVEYQAREAPVIVMEIPTGQLGLLQARQDVDAIYLARTYKPELNVSASAIDAPTVWSRNLSGRGVPVAVVEGGAIFFDHRYLAGGGCYCNDLAVSPIRPHASGVAGIIASTHPKFQGVARDVTLLSGNAIIGPDDKISDAEAIHCTEWSIDKGARVINYSFGVDSKGTLVGLDRYVDYVVRHRAVTMVKSAGNRGFTCEYDPWYVTSPGKGWNIIAVSNYDDHKTPENADDEMNRNMKSCYEDPISPHKDREKPEVAAPGADIETTLCKGPPDDCTGTGSGTSLAAPHVAGCAALLMQRNSTLKHWPESIRAILMASAVVNLEGDSRLSEHDGAGGIECDSADDIARGAGGGEQHGIVRAADSPTYTFAATAGTTVRVVIAWDSTPDAPMGTTSPTTDLLKTDFDLEIKGPDSSWITGSYSWDNSYEIVEFTAPVTGTYSAKVLKYRTENPDEYLGFAWWSGVREK
jgi:subtilisin family serine protease